MSLANEKRLEECRMRVSPLDLRPITTIYGEVFHILKTSPVGTKLIQIYHADGRRVVDKAKNLAGEAYFRPVLLHPGNIKE